MIDWYPSLEVERKHVSEVLPCSFHGHDLIDSAVKSTRCLGYSRDLSSDCLNSGNVAEMLKNGRKESKSELHRGLRSVLKNCGDRNSSGVDAPEVNLHRSWQEEEIVDEEALTTSLQASQSASGLRRERIEANSFDGFSVNENGEFSYGPEDFHCSWMEEDARSTEALDFASQCLVGFDFPEVVRRDANGVVLCDDRVNCFEPIDYEDKQCDKVACFSGVSDSDPVLSCTRRRSQLGELSSKSGIKKSSVHWGKQIKGQLAKECPDSILRAAKRKRSHSSKLVRSAQWGLSMDMPQLCCRTQEHVSKKVVNQNSQKSPGSKVDGHSNNHPNGEGAQASSERNQASRAFIRLKVKFSKSGLENKLILKLREPNGDSPVDAKHDSKELKCRKFFRKSASDAGDVDISPPSNVASASPDSEVVNFLPFPDVGEKDQDDTCRTVLSVSEAVSTNRSKRNERRNKKDNHHCTEKSIAKHVQKMEDTVCKEIPYPSPCVETLSNLSIEEEQSPELVPLLGETQCVVSAEPQKIPDLEPRFAEPQRSRSVLSSTELDGHHSPKDLKSEGVSKGKTKCLDYRKGRKKTKSGHSKKQQRLVQHSKGKKDAHNYCLENATLQHTGDHLGPRTISREDTRHHVASVSPANIDNLLVGEVKKLNPSDIAWVQCDDYFKWRRVPTSLVASIGGDARWTFADKSDKAFADCSVPQELSEDGINPELYMLNAEAYEDGGDLKLSKVAKGSECRRKSAPKKPWFRGIKCNRFLHRSRKCQTIDEVLVCHCKPPPYGQLGCGDDCLNRMLNIECVQSTCPCGDICSNQQFQQRKYAKLEMFKAGKKGHGLRVLEDVHEGQFIMEYVGEVLDGKTYEARLKDYAAEGQRHFYFMTLNANEVIDAGAKGNLGRFINHSCDPNCRTEKWMVNGEICIGIFALRDIRKEEELTFDYNYVRVFGEAAQKCYCGSSRCRGYIGGDPLESDMIVQSYSNEELPVLENELTGHDMVNPVSRNSFCGYDKVKLAEELQRDTDKMIDGEAEACEVAANSVCDYILGHFASSSSQEVDFKDISLSPVRPREFSLPWKGVTREEIVALQSDTYSERETTSASVCPTPPEDVASPAIESKLFYDGVDAVCSKSSSVGDGKLLPKSSPDTEIPRSSISQEERKSKNSSADGKKLQTNGTDNMPTNFVKHKIPSRGCSDGRIEAVESKLNELLDSDGGISKQKDATKGYLKLLLLTAALPGSASNEGIQSNRDVSMILDALLKTRSRTVLMDVTNKNGLQMLHNIIKQYKNDFKRIPILRKILKVLEYLAVRDILTLKNIIGGPPCPGMESFRDSLLSLTEHDDKQVHQIARNFRDRWIPRRYRRRVFVNKVESMTRSPSHENFRRFPAAHDYTPSSGERPSAPIIAASQRKPETASAGNTSPMDASEIEPGNCQTTTAGTCKSRTRWDQPTSRHDLQFL